jgi:fumarate reductase subunit C
MGKLVRTIFFSVLFIATLIVGVIATGHGAEAWASIRSLFVPLANFFKIALP